MHMLNRIGTLMERHFLPSGHLQREFIIDCYLPAQTGKNIDTHLLFVNDGQMLQEMGMADILDRFHSGNKPVAVMVVAIHAGENRKMEYGIASQPDYLGRGAKAGKYTLFILEELLPYIAGKYPVYAPVSKAFAGFSLGGLMAMDIVWNHPELFSAAGAFSGSFWWRSLDQADKNYNDNLHRIFQQVIRKGNFSPGLKFFFQCGNLDETKDRNGNGIIDSIDDTRDVVKELILKGYEPESDIFYLELPDGRHDVTTWGRTMPVFLEWAFRQNKTKKAASF